MMAMSISIEKNIGEEGLETSAYLPCFYTSDTQKSQPLSNRPPCDRSRHEARKPIQACKADKWKQKGPQAMSSHMARSAS